MGKICRLLLCTTSLNESSLKISPLLKNSFSSVDFVERKTKEEWNLRTVLVRTLYDNFYYKISNGRLTPKQFFIDVVLKKVIFNTNLGLDSLFESNANFTQSPSTIVSMGETEKCNKFSYNAESACYELVVKMLIQCPFWI